MPQEKVIRDEQFPMYRKVIYPFSNLGYFVLANVGVGVVITLLFSRSMGAVSEFFLNTLWSSLVSITQWAGHAYVASLIDRKVSWKERPWTRGILAVVSMTLYTLIAFFAVQLSLRYLIYDYFPPKLWDWMVEAGKIPLLFSFIIGWFFAGRGFYRSWIASERQAQRFKEEMLNYRYEALRNQINPHFLFNSFNVLSDLVYEDQDLAVKFIHQLSDLYRYVLDSREKEIVSLETELEFINSYVFLLQMRFEEKLQIDLEIETRADEYIVPMTLQLLIENAVKHNEASRIRPLKVSVRKLKEGIEVVNNLQRRNVGEDSKKTGLVNIRQQYAYQTKREIVVEETQDTFRVFVPLIHLENE